jgi:hypothetical protein
MRRLVRSALVAGALLAVPGCSNMEGEPRWHRMLIPAKQLNVSPSLTIPAESIVAGGIIYLIVDPLAPNWKVAVEPIGTRLYRVELTMKRFIVGGEGESYQVIRRTAEKLRRDGGFTEYALLEQSEGIESRVTIPQRVAHAVIELR